MSTFKDLGLNPMILQAITELGFDTPTPIQSKTIPHLINSKNDLVGLAQTGTGKTAAFSLPIIQQLNNNQEPQALILCPTRELAIQVASDIQNYIKYTSGVKVIPVFGGERVDKQIRELSKKPQIVVGTPGRVNDLINRRVLKVNSLRWLVLDEADEMLNMGFKEELDEILKTTPKEKQVLLFSATMNQQIRRIADNYMRKPDDITAGEKNKGADNVQHFYYVVHEKDRYQALRRIADINPDIHAIVFCRTRRETQLVADKLIQDHYSAEAIHGEVSQEQRTHVMNRFKDKKIQLLVATDIAARGIDVSGLSHVINYNLPESMEGYVHRSGRTGRANNLGISLVIVNMREKHVIRALERKIGKNFEKGKIPTGEDICEKQLFSLVDKVCNIEVNEERIGKYLNLINKKFEEMDREEIIKKVVSAEFNRFLEHYKNSVDLNTNTEERRERPNNNNNKSSVLYGRFKINLGRSTGLTVKDLLQLLNDQQKLRGIEIGNIDISQDYTLFEADQQYKNQVLESLKNKDIKGKKTTISCEETGIQSTRPSSRRSSSGGNRRSSGGNSGGYSGGYNGGRGRSEGGYAGRNNSSGGSHNSRGYTNRKKSNNKSKY